MEKDFLSEPAAGSQTYLVGGFTLVELMVALTVLAIAVVLAAPSYQNLIISNRVAAQINDFAARRSSAAYASRYALAQMVQAARAAPTGR